MKFDPPIPILRIFDEGKARQFYVDFLGFNVDWEHRFEPGTPIYMRISRDSCALHLSEHHGDGAPGAVVRVAVDQLEDYHEVLLGKKYKYYRPGLQDQEWGTREMKVEDGFGNAIIFFRELKE